MTFPQHPRQGIWQEDFDLVKRTIQTDLLFDDANGVDCIPKARHLGCAQRYWLRARDARGIQLKSAAHSQRTASVQGTASFHGTATSQGTAEIQRTADFQGTAEPHDAASIPKSPNDYTPTDVFQTSGGDEGLLDIYALNREWSNIMLFG
ncbi:hypothetical protein Tco_0951756 [Tanacetum coccineum]|uniref:Uncharacterized protein n=1 Tax=Tanacetum coccineum TaxID=301880 RepID=A0ABQ5DV26_9ASTR